MTINKDNINFIIEAIKLEEQFKFNMGHWFDGEYTVENKCGTSACIAGLCTLLIDEKNVVFSDNWTDESGVLQLGEADYWETGRKFLGLEIHDANALFFAQGANKSIDEITATDAIKVLEHLRETGEVDWSIIDEND